MMEGMTRRKLLLGAAAMAAAAGVGILALNQKEEKSEDFLKIKPRPRTYQMGALARVRGKDAQGKEIRSKFGEPLNIFLGVKEAQPSVDVDFRYQLAQLMQSKINKIKKVSGNVSAAQLTGIRELFESYQVPDRPQVGLGDYRNEIAHSIQEARNALDLDRLSDIEEFSTLETSELALLKKLEGKIDATTILTYALTEIMPTHGRDAPVGVEALDFLLKNAGRDFVERIPALYDKYLSFGPYQFTSFALYEGSEEMRGASVMNGISKSRQIPGSVVKLRGNGHHKAAYLFAVYNLAALVKKLPEKTCETLMAEPYAKYLTSDVVLEYIAAAHHLPANARRAFESFANQIIQFHDPQSDAKKKPRQVNPFVVHAQAADVGTYVRKTRGNRKALHKTRGW